VQDGEEEINLGAVCRQGGGRGGAAAALPLLLQLPPPWYKLGTGVSQQPSSYPADLDVRGGLELDDQPGWYAATLLDVITPALGPVAYLG
jgi:hypothetical protein